MTDTTGSFDEEFAEMISAMDMEITDADLVALEDAADQFHHEVINASSRDLIKMMKQTWVGLRALGEGLTPKTDAGRELHSRHTALKTEMLRRVDPDVNP